MYPKRSVDTVPEAKVRSFPWLLAPVVALDHLGFAQARSALEPALLATYDRWLSRVLLPCRVLHASSGSALHAHRRAHAAFGALTVCDRGAAHISVQDRLLREESATWGISIRSVPKTTIARELAEYEECDAILVPSRFARRTFIEQGVHEDKVVTIPLGVDLTLFRRQPRRDNAFRVLYVGSLTLQKGLPYLLEAMTRPRISGCELRLIGPRAPETNEILARFPNGYEYLGPISRDRLPNYYSEASVLVLPSIQDGFGMVMTQAMACGLPVIATTNTGVTEIFSNGDAGYHIPIRDPGAIRHAIITLRDNPDELRRLATNALERVTQMQGWNAYGDNVASFYLAALNAAQ